MILHDIIVTSSDYENKKAILFDFRGEDERYRNFIKVTPGHTTMLDVIGGLRDLAADFERRLKHGPRK